METIEQIRDRIVAVFPDAEVTLFTNPGLAAEHSLVLGHARAREIAFWLRDDPALRLDYCSNATGVDYLDKEIVETTKVKAVQPDGTEKVVDQKTKRFQAGYLESVYHLYSMALKHGPLVIRLRTANRADQAIVPSLTPVWRSCEFQEREIFDLYGIVFEGHPDLRRILMWDEFKDFPMRKDYAEPDDYEWEPTPHDTVLVKTKEHYPVVAAVDAPATGKPAAAAPSPTTDPAAGPVKKEG